MMASKTENRAHILHSRHRLCVDFWFQSMNCKQSNEHGCYRTIANDRDEEAKNPSYVFILKCHQTVCTLDSPI